MVTALLLAAAVVALGLTVQLIPGASTGELSVDQDLSRHHVALLTGVAMVLNLLFGPAAGVRDAPPASKPGQALTRIRDDTSTLTAIVNELLLAATGGAAESPTEPVDVAEVTASVADSLRQIAHEAGVGLKVTSGGRTLARIDPNSLRRAILALVDNALAHTPPGGTIALATAGTPRSAVITVTDTGSGISGVERDRIFERFVRTPRVDVAPGHRSFGIGLALVRDVVTGAGGTVEIAGTGPQGTT
ncbi:signal transduction histidine kinase [Arthrobacter sp. UYNi723]